MKLVNLLYRCTVPILNLNSIVSTHLYFTRKYILQESDFRMSYAWFGAINYAVVGFFLGSARGKEHTTLNRIPQKSVSAEKEGHNRETTLFAFLEHSRFIHLIAQFAGVCSASRFCMS